jgi:peptidoglycan hydrolase-like protein with peptidoglycan-binding domain
MSGIGGIGRPGISTNNASEAASLTTPPPAAAGALASPQLAASATLRGILEGHGVIGYFAQDRAAAKLIQQALVDLGYLAPSPGADGIFGRQSVNAVLAFQRAEHLHADGVVGRDTLRALDARLAARSGGSAAPTAPSTPSTPTTPAAPSAPTAPTGPVAPAAPPPGMRVVEGTSEYSLDDDTLYMTGEGKWSSSINRDIYTAGYLPRTEGPLFHPLGSKAQPSAVLPAADNALNTDKSPVERFDEAMKRATGTSGKLTDRYKVEGKQPEAKDWWGYCDRWSYNALDPEIATRVNKPIMYNGVYFSTAELRGLATFLGRADESGGLFDSNVTPLDLQKAATLFLKTNGPGFIGDVWLDSAHPNDRQVWNQPFDAVDQNAKELKGADLEKVLKEQFNLTGPAAAGKKVYYVETTGHYGVEAGEEHEGAATHATKTWKSWILTDASGKALDGKWAPGSADALEYIWRPTRTGNFGPEAKFFRDMLKAGVPADQVKAFEQALGTPPLSAEKKADLKSRFRGIAAAYPAAALNAKLAPYGLSAADFK